MSLVMLPGLVWPITSKQADALHVNTLQMNTLDAGLTDRDQRALGINFDIYDLLSKAGRDYTGKAGHDRLYQDASSFVGSGSPIVTRHGDLRAAHLAIDFNDTQIKLAAAGLPPMSGDVNVLVSQVRDLTNLPPKEDERIALFLRYLLKKG